MCQFLQSAKNRRVSLTPIIWNRICWIAIEFWSFLNSHNLQTLRSQYLCETAFWDCRIVAIATDCKSVNFGYRWFKSTQSHPIPLNPCIMQIVLAIMLIYDDIGFWFVYCNSDGGLPSLIICRQSVSIFVRDCFLDLWLNGYNATLSRCEVRVRIPLGPLFWKKITFCLFYSKCLFNFAS